MAEKSFFRFKTREIVASLVVLVVLAISLTAYLQSKKGDTASVVNARNLQQWGIALNLFLIENENQLPEVGTTPIEASQEKAWYNALPAYLGQTPLAQLAPGQRPQPGVRSLWIDPATKAPRIWDPEVFYFNYGMNRFLQPDPNLRSFKIYEIDFPGNVVFLAEVDAFEPDATPDTVVFRRDKNVSHVLFCDGHIAPVTRATLVENPATRQAANAATGVSWFEE